MTRAIALWLLLAVVLLAGALLARRRGVGATRFLSAWVLASALLWACAGLFGYAGARVTAASDARAGIAVGTPLGALLGAPLGIALSERGLHDAWPRWRALALAAAVLAVVVAIFLLVLTRVGAPGEQAGLSVFVVYPMLGAAAVLGWLIGERR
jgi:threonine/homoserine efflux transporter RhtA